MKAIIFARRLFAGNWGEELERVLGIESEKFYLLSEAAIKAANQKADIVIVQVWGWFLFFMSHRKKEREYELNNCAICH